MDKIGQRIKARREQLNISQDELASLTGYADKSAICRFESMGKSSRNIKIENLEPFAKALKTTVPYLMGLTNDPDLSLEEVIKNDAQNTLFPQFFEQTNDAKKQNESEKIVAYNNGEKIELTDFDYALHGETKNMTEEQKAAIMQMAKTINATNKGKN